MNKITTSKGKNMDVLIVGYTDLAKKYYEDGLHTEDAICRQARKEGLFSGPEDTNANLFRTCVLIVIIKQKIKDEALITT